MASVDGLGIPGITDPVRVGQGGFGTVYRASQPAYRRTVAVKVMSGPMLDDEGQRAFERECQALGSLSSHPNIVSLYAAGISDFERPYMIMDYLPGGSLGDRIVGHPLGWQEAVEIGIKVSGALATAHAAGVLHRDVKPENILLSAYGEPQLADFGVARLQGGTRTATGTITGSLAHAAPEVLSGVSATEASDVWSLASTVATLILGRPPFHRDGETSLHPLITRILTGAPTDLRPLGVPDVMCEAIEAALVKDSWDRTPTAIAFGESLQAAQQALGMPVTSLPAPGRSGRRVLRRVRWIPSVDAGRAAASPPPPVVSAAGPPAPAPAGASPGAGPGRLRGPVAGVAGREEDSTRYRFVRSDLPTEADPELATRRRGSLPEVPVAGLGPEAGTGAGAVRGRAGGVTPAPPGPSWLKLPAAPPAPSLRPPARIPPPAAAGGPLPAERPRPPAGRRARFRSRARWEAGPPPAGAGEELVTRLRPDPAAGRHRPDAGAEDATRRRVSVESLAAPLPPPVLPPATPAAPPPPRPARPPGPGTASPRPPGPW